MIRYLVAALLLLGSAASAAAEPVVILVRHAERADGGTGGKTVTDPDLSDAGRARATALVRLLKDAPITAIYTTELKRTQQTAAPLAAALKVRPTIVPASATGDLLRALDSARGTVLVVGHSNTVPDLIGKLGVQDPVTIADDEFDGVFVVFRGAEPTLLRLRY
jgi:phosphohistidine phosphatase SixA